MKVLFAVPNEKISENIVKRYQKEYKEILSYKNVYFYNAIVKEIQKDKTYDRIIISEDLEPFSNNNFEEIDKFLFNKLDAISDEGQNMDGEEIPIILLCNERRAKANGLLVKLFGIGVYNALIGQDRTTTEVCKLISRPRNKKEAKTYYRIDVTDVQYQNGEDGEEVKEVEIQNILNYYKKLGNNEDAYADSFNNIASQYSDQQLKIIINCLPKNVRVVLERESDRYKSLITEDQKLGAGESKIIKVDSGITDVKISTSQIKPTNGIVIPSSKRTVKRQAEQINPASRVVTPKTITVKQSPSTIKPVQPVEEVIEEEILEKTVAPTVKAEPNIKQEKNDEIISDIKKVAGAIEKNGKVEAIKVEENTEKRGRGRPRKYPLDENLNKPKRGRGRPRKNPLPEDVITTDNLDEVIAAPVVEKATPVVNEKPILSADDIEDVVIPDLDIPEVDVSTKVEKPVTKAEPKTEEIVAPVADDDFADIDDDDDLLPVLGDDDEIHMVADDDDDLFGIDDEEDVLPSLDDEEDVLPSLDDEEDVLPSLDDEEDVLPSLDEEEDVLPSLDEEEDVLPSLDDEEEILPSLEDEEDVLPSLDDEEDILPSLDEEDDVLPSLDEDDEILPSLDDEEDVLPSLDEDDEILPSLDDEEDVLPSLDDEEDVLPSLDEDDEILPSLDDEEDVLPSLDDEEDVLPSLDDEEDVLPSLDDEEDVLPSLDDEEDVLPSLDDEEDVLPSLDDEEDILPSLDDEEDVLPGLEDDDDLSLPSLDDEEDVLPSLDDEDEILPGLEDDDDLSLPSLEDEDEILPSLDDEEDVLPSLDDEEDVLPGLEDDDDLSLPSLEDDEELPLPGLDDDDDLSLPSLEDDEELPLPGLDDDDLALPSLEDDEELPLPGLDDDDLSLPSLEDDEELPLPGLDDDDDLSLPSLEDDEELPLPSLDDDDDLASLPGISDDDELPLPSLDDDDDLASLPGLSGDEDVVAPVSAPTVTEDSEEDELLSNLGISDEEDDIPVVNNNNINMNSNNIEVSSIKSNIDYSSANLNSILSRDKKVAVFVGTSKNGTSFLVNTLAAMFSQLANVKTAILDMTKNKNSYYMYTDSDENLRKIAYNSIEKLKNGFAEGINVNKNLTVYTALPNDNKDYSDADAILSTLVQNYSVVLIDTDFDTDPGYFALAQEIYLVQSLDVMTVQPLTAFLRELKTKGILNPEKLRVVVNKDIKVKNLTTKAIIGAMSRYTDPGMDYLTDLFSPDTIKACTIPFEDSVYSKYLEAIATCKMNISGYSKNFMNKLKTLGRMVYPQFDNGKQVAPVQNYATQNATNNFSSSMNDTLSKMKRNMK